MPAIEIPSLIGFNSKVFRPAYAQQTSAIGTQGFVQTIDRTRPFWIAQYTTPGLTRERENEMLAFLDHLSGSTNTFLAYDPRRQMPYAYQNMPVGSYPWGVVNVVGYDYANSTLDLDNLNVGAVITKGDYISFQYNLAWYLFRSLETLTVDGSKAATVEVHPRPDVPGLSPGTAVAIRYQKAVCEMKQVGDPDISDSVDSLPVYKIQASQFTNRATS